MNKIYNIVWSSITQTWVVCSELTSSRSKKSLKKLATTALVGSALTIGSQVAFAG